MAAAEWNESVEKCLHQKGAVPGAQVGHLVGSIGVLHGVSIHAWPQSPQVCSGMARTSVVTGCGSPDSPSLLGHGGPPGLRAGAVGATGLRWSQLCYKKGKNDHD